MTSRADRDGKVYHPRRARRAQLHEAGAAALTAVRPLSPSDLAAPKAVKAKRPIITGIASGCAPASGKRVRAPLPITSSSNSFFFARSRDAT